MDDGESRFKSSGIEDLRANIEGATSARQLESYGARIIQTTGIVVACTHPDLKNVFYFNDLHGRLSHYSTT